MSATQDVRLVISATGSMEPTLSSVAAAFQAATGVSVHVTYQRDTDQPDVLVMPMDALERRNGFVGNFEEGAISLGRNVAGIGVAVRKDTAIPAVASVDAFKRALLGAERILLTTRVSGIYMNGVLKEMGIDDLVEGKIRREPTAQALVDRLARGDGNELLVLPVREILANAADRVLLVGPIPEEFQVRPEFFVVPRSESTQKDVAWAFVRFCDGPARHLFVAGGFK